MKKHRLKNIAAVAVAAGLLPLGGVVSAQTVGDVTELDAAKIEDAVEAQTEVNQVADATEQIVIDYKVVNKEIQGLRAYNAQLELQIQDQERALANLDESISNAAGMERFIAPLMENMIEALRQFVMLDLPFNREDRIAAVERLQGNIPRSDLSLAEKFRQVLEVYKIESDYSNNIDSYADVISVDGVDLDVNIIRIGRIAMMYQTKDQAKSGYWSTDTNQWGDLDSGEYRNALAQTLKIAKKQASIDILTVPVAAPETAQ